MSVAPQTSGRLSAQEAEAIATSVALHHYRAAQAAASGGAATEPVSTWTRESLLAGVERNSQRVTSWGLRNWG